MNAEDWKEKLTWLCGEVTDKYKDLENHINALDNIPWDIDMDEIFAFAVIKIQKMNKEISSSVKD